MYHRQFATPLSKEWIKNLNLEAGHNWLVRMNMLYITDLRNKRVTTIYI